MAQGSDIYYQAPKTQYQSQFVQMPLDFLAGAIGDRQKKYDKQDLLQEEQLGDWSHVYLRGSQDEKYVGDTKKKIRDFLDSSKGKDLGSSEYAKEYAKFVRSIRDDKNLGVIKSNYEIVQEAEEKIKKLQESGKFLDANVFKYKQDLQNYLQGEGYASGKVLDPSIFSALDVRKKQEDYFNNIPKSGGDSLAKLGETYYKTGWTGISSKRIQSEALKQFEDYYQTPEAAQQIREYEMRKAQGDPMLNSKGEPMSAAEYVFNSFLTTGSSFVGGTSSSEIAGALNAERERKDKLAQANPITAVQDQSTDASISVKDVIDKAKAADKAVRVAEGAYNKAQQQLRNGEITQQEFNKKKAAYEQASQENARLKAFKNQVVEKSRKKYNESIGYNKQIQNLNDKVKNILPDVGVDDFVNTIRSYESGEKQIDQDIIDELKKSPIKLSDKAFKREAGLRQMLRDIKNSSGKNVSESDIRNIMHDYKNLQANDRFFEKIINFGLDFGYEWAKYKEEGEGVPLITLANKNTFNPDTGQYFAPVINSVVASIKANPSSMNYYKEDGTVINDISSLTSGNINTLEEKNVVAFAPNGPMGRGPGYYINVSRPASFLEKHRDGANNVNERVFVELQGPNKNQVLADQAGEYDRLSKTLPKGSADYEAAVQARDMIQNANIIDQVEYIGKGYSDTVDLDITVGNNIYAAKENISWQVDRLPGGGYNLKAVDSQGETIVETIPTSDSAEEVAEIIQKGTNMLRESYFDIKESNEIQNRLSPVTESGDIDWSSFNWRNKINYNE